MSLTTAFVSELVWAANQVDQLTEFEKRRLLERAMVTIRELRNQVGDLTGGATPDPVSYLQSTANAMQDSERVSTAMLDAAGMIRTLRIILHG
ncbi:hypothetical protein [Ensifer sesbaniae]|uniref:hypothetical protein n=1 Tax=Ensifer sesbaniae TaxID=1214071 RepID=UPI001567E70F|nr:hypothetical protein [Ensifer sesbaniae]NRQ13487.1 hypothetical protein [Ensifer sesbaniae]